MGLRIGSVTAGGRSREEGALCGGGPCAIGECIFFV